MGVSHLELRVNRLEEDNYFLQTRLEELNTALTFQQKQIDKVQTALERAQQLIEQLRGQAMRDGDLPANDPPPHYSTW